MFAEPNFQIAPRPAVLLFISNTFGVRVAQDFKRFEQGRPQRAILPGGFFDNDSEEPTLLGGGLLQEQLARTARQPVSGPLETSFSELRPRWPSRRRLGAVSVAGIGRTCRAQDARVTRR